MYVIPLTQIEIWKDKIGTRPSKNDLRSDTMDPAPEPKRKGRPPKPAEEKSDRMRFNLLLDRDLYEHIEQMRWVLRKSMSDYINDVIRADMGRYLKSCVKSGVEPHQMDPYKMDDAFNMFAKLFSAYMEGSEPPKEKKPRTIKPFKVEDPEVLEVIARITKSSHCSKNEALLRMAHAHERQ